MNVVGNVMEGQSANALAQQKATQQQYQANTQADQDEYQAFTQANETEYQANTQATSMEYSAKVAREDAMFTASLIRKQQRLAIGTSQATSAASGVVVGEGSAAEADRQIYRDSEQDALMSILSGERQGRGLDADAALTRQSGKANADYMRQSGKANADFMRQSGNASAAYTRQAGANAEANGLIKGVSSGLRAGYDIAVYKEEQEQKTVLASGQSRNTSGWKTAPQVGAY